MAQNLLMPSCLQAWLGAPLQVLQMIPTIGTLPGAIINIPALMHHGTTILPLLQFICHGRYQFCSPPCPYKSLLASCTDGHAVRCSIFLGLFLIISCWPQIQGISGPWWIECHGGQWPLAESMPTNSFQGKECIEIYVLAGTQQIPVWQQGWWRALGTLSLPD